jgi:hypothetical protein
VEDKKSINSIEQLQDIIKDILPRAEILEDKYGSIVIDTMFDLTTAGDLVRREDTDAMSTSGDFACIDI